MEPIPGETKIGHYQFERPIGSGAFASVWLAIHELTNVKAAVKIITKTTIRDENAVTLLTRELNFLKQMRHPFIIEFYENFEDDYAHYYCMEYAENGNLLNYITNSGALPENQARHYFSQMVAVLDYLHSELHVSHRDIKAENLLLDRHNNIRVIDFGLSNKFTSGQATFSTACGSPPYVSPEMVKGHAYTQAADIWSAGVLLYAMSTAVLPFDDGDIQALFRKIVTQEVAYPSFLSPALVDLLRRMLTKSPDQRITLAQIKEHEWFSQGQYLAFFALHLGEKSTEAVVDSIIVEKMSQMGIETATLRQQLMLGVFTELTAMYRMLRRERLADQIHHIVAALPGSGKEARRKLPNQPYIDASVQQYLPVRGRGAGLPKASQISPCVVPGQGPHKVPAKTPGAPYGGNRLPTAPQPYVVRRFSRPLAVARMVPASESNSLGSATPPDSDTQVMLV
jgi:hypothetical protein